MAPIGIQLFAIGCFLVSLFIFTFRVRRPLTTFQTAIVWVDVVGILFNLYVIAAILSRPTVG